ncbi:MAG: protein kinase [Polyangiaceae bacterium]
MASSFGFEPGTVIGDVYRVIGVIGRGGMGVVLRAHDERLERDVAIKLIRPELLNDDLRERFLAEARAMARVAHANVLPIYSFGEHEGAPYFVTKILNGRTVEDWIKAARKQNVLPDLDTAFSILDETCKGVSAIHAAETVHRDLKPSNLLMDEDGSISVADMGVATLRDTMHDERRSGEIVGTPYYMAPESVLQSDVAPELAHRADVYALGCLAYELFTGAPPFTGTTMVACMLAHLNQEAPAPSSRRADLTSDIDAVILAALAKKPEDRTPTVDAFRRALADARAHRHSPVRILVAEDDEDFRELLTEALRRDFPDATIESVGDGRAALEAMNLRPPSVAIIDLQMPEIDGIQLIEHLREKAIASSVPIIVMTGSGGAQEWKHLSALGAESFLMKPVNVRDVAPILNRVLADRASTPPALPVPEPMVAAR